MNLVLMVIFSLTAAAVVSIWIFRWIQLIRRWMFDKFSYRNVALQLSKVPLSPADWQRLADFARAKHISQNAYLAEAVKHYNNHLEDLLNK